MDVVARSVMRRTHAVSIVVLLLGCPRTEPSSVAPGPAPTPEPAPGRAEAAATPEAASTEQGWLAPSDMVTRPTSMEGFPTPVEEHTAVWTGEVVLFFGGNEAFPKEDDGYRPVDPIGRADGGIYDPVADTWRPLPSAPIRGRFDHVAAWTGTEMLVFGGRDAKTAFGDGAAYDPAKGTWRSLASKGAPSGRSAPGAAWTGSELVVVGGRDTKGRARSDAFAYDPAKDAWRSLGKLAPREEPTAVWTGEQIVVWGGVDPNSAAPKGERLEGGQWQPLASAGAPAVRPQQVAIWAGTSLVVWGGRRSDDAFAKDGARWDPAADAWTPLSTVDAHARIVQGAVFTGEVVAVLGDAADMMDMDEPPGSLGLYNPVRDQWWSLPGPYASDGIALAWTGHDLVAWGGHDGTNMSPTGDRIRLR
jgi:hypothetical protein